MEPNNDTSDPSDAPGIKDGGDLEFLREAKETTGLSLKAIRQLLETDAGLDDVCDLILSRLAATPRA